MKIPNEQMEIMIGEYKVYINKIINHTYYRAELETKDELRHVGLIGLWKGITAYYKRNPKEFDRKEFVDTICTYIRYEMADLFRTFSVIRIGGKQWRNFVEVKRIVNANPDASEERLNSLAAEAGIRYDWYVKARRTMNLSSLDADIGDDEDTDMLNFIPYYEQGIKSFIDKTYVDYIIDSALTGMKQERDKNLIQSWLDSIYYTQELEQTELAKIYNLSSSMVGVIINRFIEVCRFVRDCESEFHTNPNGCISFPVVAEKSMEHNGQKIPGVKWALRNRKWKVEITVGKNNSIFIGLFENYEDAVRARRDAEIQYRGQSDIEV